MRKFSSNRYVKGSRKKGCFCFGPDLSFSSRFILCDGILQKYKHFLTIPTSEARETEVWF